MNDVRLHMFNVGEQIGSYRVRRRLGAGGMGEVYLAEHRNIDRKAAIKVLLPELASDQEIVSRFFTEARAASRIKHPGIVEIIDCEVDPRGRAFIAMEFLDGESLGSSLERGASFDVSPALGIVGQIAGALAAAHAKGIVHRDLKPDNVFLASTPQADAPISVKILDFGIAKLLADGGHGKRKTQTGSLLGTPLYMSPEQCRGAGTLDHRTDIYSLGCIAFELLAGRPPFVKDGAGELIAAHLTEPAPDLTSFQPSVHPDFARLVTSMLAKDPAARPQTMLDVVAEIERQLALPATQFLKAIHPPDGFPTAANLDEDPLPPEPVAPTSPSYRGMFGRTEVMPESPSVAPAPVTTTFSQTASELSTPTQPPVRRRLPWLVGICTVTLIAGVGALVARRPSPPIAGHSGPLPVEPRPPEAIAPPVPPTSQKVRPDERPPLPEPAETPPISPVVAEKPVTPPPEARPPARKRKPPHRAADAPKSFNYIPE
jgi:serine/threonine protein kinase